jgi:uncharacterized protein
VAGPARGHTRHAEGNDGNVSLIFLIPIGIIIGMLSALLGIGGGLLYVPALASVGATPVQAGATSLLAITLGAISGTIQNFRRNSLSLEAVSMMTFPAMLTTELGVAIALALPAHWLLLFFAGLQIAAIWLINMKNKLQRQQERDEEPAPETPSAPKKREPALIFRVQGIGLAAGILSGLFGVGGGIIMVPMQVMLLRMPIKKAIQTSYGAIVLISLWAVGRYAIANPGNLLLWPGLMLGFGSLFGASFGARLLPKLSDRLVRILFTVLLISLSTYIVLKAVLS